MLPEKSTETGIRETRRESSERSRPEEEGKTQLLDSTQLSIDSEKARRQSMNCLDSSVTVLTDLMHSVRDEIQEREKGINPGLINSAAACASQVHKLLKLKLDALKTLQKN